MKLKFYESAYQRLKNILKFEQDDWKLFPIFCTMRDEQEARKKKYHPLVAASEQLMREHEIECAEGEFYGTKYVDELKVESTTGIGHEVPAFATLTVAEALKRMGLKTENMVEQELPLEVAMEQHINAETPQDNLTWDFIEPISNVIQDEERQKLLPKKIPYETKTFRKQVQGRMKDMKIATRVTNSLKHAHILTYGDLVKRTEKQMLDLWNFGPLSLKAIKQHLDKVGLEFRK
jgi:hypothetical protein